MTRPTDLILDIKNDPYARPVECDLIAWIDYLESLPEVRRRLEDEAQREFSESIDLEECHE